MPKWKEMSGDKLAIRMWDSENSNIFNNNVRFLAGSDFGICLTGKKLMLSFPPDKHY